jgi:hypothetical protein
VFHTPVLLLPVRLVFVTRHRSAEAGPGSKPSRSPVMQTKVLGSPQSLQASTGIVPQTGQRPPPSTSFQFIIS